MKKRGSKTQGKQSLSQRRITLEVYRGETPIFSSRGRWLHPLFELAEYVDQNNLDTSSLVLRDRIAGRAAAALICRMGFTRCHIGILSQLALSLFEKHRVDCTYSSLVRRIACRTEEVIRQDMDLEEIYRLLRQRIGSGRGIALKIQNLKAGYRGKPVLKGLNLFLPAGEQLIITGDNGMGKTTLLKAITGVIPLGGGSIILGDPENPQKRGTPSPVGYVSQITQHVPFPLTAEEVVAMGLAGRRLSRKKAKDRVEAAMRRTGSCSLGRRNFYTLSGGERQRVSLARCLCQEAGLILLDEPTSFLDADGRDDFREVLREIVFSQKPTVLLTSHDHQWINQLGWTAREMRQGRL